MRVAVLTSNQLRHRFFRKVLGLSEGIEVVRSYCEGDAGAVDDAIAQRAATEDTSLRSRHLAARQAVEQDFFGAFVDLAPDCSNPVLIARKEINSDAVYADLNDLDPDLLICYGTSIIREPLLSRFAGRFINVHLGLSPYYRGAGTNFWALVDGKPEAVGVTFMHIDAGIDTGEIIHQMRARVRPLDGPHQIGNRLIVDAARAATDLIKAFSRLERLDPLPQPDEPRICRQKDLTEESVRRLYDGFAAGLVDDYLRSSEARAAAMPILENPALKTSSKATVV